MAEEPETPVALVLTDQPVPIAVAQLQDDRTPEGMVCLGTTLDGRLIGRCVVPPEMAAFLDQSQLLASPVPLALAATEEPPGLQCRLFAVVDLPAGALEEPDSEEPWAASVPSSDFDKLIRAEKGEGEAQRAAILLGHVVRFARDRKHPGNLPLEAADVLATLVSGRAGEVVDKVLEDLLGPP